MLTKSVEKLTSYNDLQMLDDCFLYTITKPKSGFIRSGEVVNFNTCKYGTGVQHGTFRVQIGQFVYKVLYTAYNCCGFFQRNCKKPQKHNRISL